MIMTIETSDLAQSPAQQPTAWEALGQSLGHALESIGITRTGVGVLLMGGAALLSGCSPQNKSYWNNTFTALPNPPAEARMQLGVSTEEDGTVFINYVTWNAESKQFERKDVHYTTTVTHPGSFSAAGGYSQKIHHGEVLYGDAIVDQHAGKILLGNGNSIDGETGNIFDKSGELVIKLEHTKDPVQKRSR